MAGTLFLLAVVYFVFITVLAYIGVETLLLLVIVTVILVIQYFFSDKITLWSMGARQVSEQEEPHLYETLTRLCTIAGVPRPKLAIVDNAFPMHLRRKKSEKFCYCSDERSPHDAQPGGTRGGPCP
jgi:heat shock protein HtpX